MVALMQFLHLQFTILDIRIICLYCMIKKKLPIFKMIYKAFYRKKKFFFSRDLSSALMTYRKLKMQMSYFVLKF